MIRLGKMPRKPYDLDLVYEVKVRVRPITTAVIESARAGAIRQLTLLREEIASIKEVGGEIAGLPDFDNEDIRNGLQQQHFIEALAVAGILSWEGVMDESGTKPAEVNPQTISDFMAIPAVARDFLAKYSEPYDEMVIEGNGLPTAPNGTSEPGVVGSGAPSVESSTAPAVGES